MHIAISDLHLSAGRPDLIAGFERLCARLPASTQSLWILGDLFDFWIGDDHPEPSAARVATALQELAERRIRVHFVPGNRDFLLGGHFAAAAGMQYHPNGKVLVMNGRPTWLIHGDHLCIDDSAYMAFRRQVRHPAWQQEFLALPLEERLAQAQQARQASSTENASKPEDIMDVNPDYAAEQTERHGALDLLHGHTHRPALHTLSNQGSRFVLGDWHDGQAVICQWSDTRAPALLRFDYTGDSASLGTPL